MFSRQSVLRTGFLEPARQQISDSAKKHFVFGIECVLQVAIDIYLTYDLASFSDKDHDLSPSFQAARQNSYQS
jgi:hypothetical protein